MLSTDVGGEVPAGESDGLREQVVDLFLHLFERLHSGPVGPWLELDLTMPQLKMLLVVEWLGPVPMSQLAGQLGVSLPTATGLVDRLVEARLARRESDTRDRRVVRACSTETGRALVVRLRSAGSERLGRVLEHLSAEDLHRCAAVLEAISGAAETELRAGEQSIPTASMAAGQAEAGR